LVAWESGFAPIESIIDHAIQLDADRPMHLYWLSAIPRGRYLSNYCRAWVDALDHFHYHPIDLAPVGRDSFASVFRRIAARHAPLAGWDLYLALPETAGQLYRELFRAQGLSDGQLRVTVLSNP
jgi:CDP-4-dehydro-6-deoxyglucose reductase